MEEEEEEEEEGAYVDHLAGKGEVWKAPATRRPTCVELPIRTSAKAPERDQEDVRGGKCVGRKMELRYGDEGERGQGWEVREA